MPYRWGVYAAAVAVLSGPGVCAWGQQANGEQTPQAAAAPHSSITVTTRLVVLDVVVNDSKGVPRGDLHKEDFHITENGMPVKIVTFEGPEVHTQPLLHKVDSTAELDLYAPQAPVDLIVLDEVNTKFEDMAYARYSVEKYLKAQGARLAAPTMLLAVSRDKFQVLRDYTQDKAAIQSALDHHLTAYPWHLQVAFNPIRQLATSLGTLEQVAAATSGHPGHKNLIWIGKGFPGIDLTGDSMDQQTATQLSAAVETAVNHLRDGRITLYTIDPTPLSSTLQSTSDDASTTGDDDGVSAPDPFAGDINFKSIAPETGGKAFYSRNDIDRELGQSVRDGSNYYTISYRPPPPVGAERPYRKIRVRFDQKGLTAAYRQGYYTAPEAPAKPDSQRVQYDLYAAETGTLSYTGFSLAGMRKPGTVDTYVLVAPEEQIGWIDGAEETPAAGTQSAKLTLVATSLGKNGELLRRATVELTARRNVKSAPVADAVARFEIELPESPKATHVRLVLRGADGRIGTADVDPRVH